MPTLEMTPGYFISGDFDSRKRFLRSNPAGAIALCSGVTWELGTGNVAAGSPWQPYEYNIQGRVNVTFETYTFGSTTQTASVPTPSNIVTGMSF